MAAIYRNEPEIYGSSLVPSREMWRHPYSAYPDVIAPCDTDVTLMLSLIRARNPEILQSAVVNYLRLRQPTGTRIQRGLPEIARMGETLCNRDSRPVDGRDAGTLFHRRIRIIVRTLPGDSGCGGLVAEKEAGIRHSGISGVTLPQNEGVANAQPCRYCGQV